MIPGDPDDRTWPDSFSVENFENFCRRRSELIVARVREVVGESLRSDDSEAEPEEDDGL